VFNANGLYIFWWAKKKSSYYIIPPSHFRKKNISPTTRVEKKNLNPQIVNNIAAVATKPVVIASNKTELVSSDIEKSQKTSINTPKKRTSGLSLSSIRAKKEHQIKQQDVVVKEEDLPKNPFSQEELLTAWNTFVNYLQEEGKYNLASILSIDTPKLKGTTIHLKFPNETNKVEVERQQFDLLNYLRKTLQNYDISLDIVIVEELEKKYAYTPEEKYQKLKEKNPNLELLRKTFDLDL